MKRILIGMLLMSTILLADNIDDKIVSIRGKVKDVKSELVKMKIGTEDDLRFCLQISEIVNSIAVHLDSYEKFYNESKKILDEEKKDGLYKNLDMMENNLSNTVDYIKSKQ